jgi:hypothetical protein
VNDQQTSQPPTQRPESHGPSKLRVWLEHIGLVIPKGEPDRWSHRRGEPRGFAVLWMCFLLISTLSVFMALGDPVRVTAEGYREGARMLVTVIAIGITVMWPMVRLSQVVPVGGGVIVVAKDLVILLVPLQAVLWPQVVITGWTVSAVAASDVLLISWALVIGAFLAIALGPGRRIRLGEQKLDPDRKAPRPGLERTFWMLALVVAILLGPFLLIWLQSIGRAQSDDAKLLLRMSSPLTAPWEMLKDRVWTGQHAAVGAAHWRATWMTACLAVSMWILVAIIRGAGINKLAQTEHRA